MLDKLEDDEYAYQCKENTYYPFHDKAEWQLRKFLVENLTQTQIAKFLKLTWTGQPIELIWHDALDMVKQLFSNPTFANHMTFDPHVVQAGDQHEYGDYMSADMAWKIQDHLPMGTTQVPIILVTGGLKMHLVFITISNIDSEFKVHPDYQTILQAQLWHKCMDLILANLKAAAAEGCFMLNPFQYIHYIFTPLMAHVCNLPEASMIAATSKSASPLTMATQKEFGDGTLHPPCTGWHTLQLIVDISKTIDPWDLDKFQKAAKAVYLFRVHMPLWCDWKYACPSVFLAAEILHTCHKFFFDHLLNWVKEAVGKHELDACFAIQHKHVRTHHFAQGVTHIKQMTGHEHRDIQCTIVASIIGATPLRFIFHLPDSLKSMVQSLADFHSFKDAIIDSEARRGKNGAKEDFFIHKLELLQGFCGMFLADVMEHLLITHCKDLFSWTSRQSKDFALQCVWILNRQEDEDVITTNPALSWVS
ncbi:hypothetical protein BDR06DRAFT_985719 [Suillus hirtellus]|nr:hypothetical protein BDR06DRAFT_985719 [Suillus hirtellus]